jgi:hypothetical protein
MALWTRVRIEGSRDAQSVARRPSRLLASMLVRHREVWPWRVAPKGTCELSGRSYRSWRQPVSRRGDPRAIARSDQGQKRPLSGRLPRCGNGARLRADCPVEDRRARPAIPRSMSFYDTCVAPRYRNGPTGRRRLTGAEAFELEGMDPCYIDIDGFWPKGADSKGPESVPIAN